MTTFYVFGESPNDTNALVQLIYARSEADRKNAKAIALRTPLIHQKKGTPAKRRSNAEKVESAVRARSLVKAEALVVVVAHEDCDDVEPAHIRISERIEEGLNKINVPVIGAAPAFEMEAWWYLWPDAVASVCKQWKRLGRTNTEIGLMRDIKETLKRDLCPPRSRPTREYSEADSVAIASRVRSMKIIDKRSAKSASYESFEKKIQKHL